MLFTRGAHVVAIRLTLSHVFVDALGAQVVARHLRQLLAGDVDFGFRAPRQASVFAEIARRSSGQEQARSIGGNARERSEIMHVRRGETREGRALPGGARAA
ncbi:hypothetical protein ACRAWF_07295 [Streptomyces sp. L7]